MDFDPQQFRERQSGSNYRHFTSLCISRQRSHTQRDGQGYTYKAGRLGPPGAPGAAWGRLGPPGAAWGRLGPLGRLAFASQAGGRGSAQARETFHCPRMPGHSPHSPTPCAVHSRLGLKRTRRTLGGETLQEHFKKVYLERECTHALACAMAHGHMLVPGTVASTDFHLVQDPCFQTVSCFGPTCNLLQ